MKEEEVKTHIGFELQQLPLSVKEAIRDKARRARGDILTMTRLASSGHPGGSMSSIDMYMTLYACARVNPRDPFAPDRDRIIVSHGHTSPGVYAALAYRGFVDIDDVICGFRQPWSPFEGHIEREVPGVEWSTGNLGQGLSAGCGMALASRLHGTPFHVYVCMGDGEQQKGQISEARRFAAKYKLTNLTALIDYNHLQISGDIHAVMPQNIRAEWESEGWDVIEIDGHDIDQIYSALRLGTHTSERPLCVLARTVMGKGVPFMENQHKYHGAPVKMEDFDAAMSALGLENRLEDYRSKQQIIKERVTHQKIPNPVYNLDTGTPRTYTPEQKVDNRGAWGHALADIARLNADRADATPIAVLDCDLAASVKTGGFAEVSPERFFQGGIQEHNTAVLAGALSAQGILTFWSDFGVFGVDEVYNQQRLNDINLTHLKTVCTHCGLDVGEDGKTHQSIDYVGLLRNAFNYRIVLPADPNECDRVIRWAATQPGNIFIGMGRSKLPILTDEDGSPAFGGGYRFEYGRALRLRGGRDATILSTGTMTHRAVLAHRVLRERGISAGVIHFPCPTEIDIALLREAAGTGVLVSVEDHNPETGLGASIALAMIDNGLSASFRRLGPRTYQPSGPAEQIFAQAGLDTKGIAAAVEALVGESSSAARR